MLKINNITNESFQRHILLFQESEVIITLRFLSMVSIWVLDVEYKGKKRNGFKLSVDTLHMLSSNYPFDFIVNDNSNFKLDPININDFANGRCSLFLLEPPEIEFIRGVLVEI